MNEKNGIGESKPKQSRRKGESATELPVGRAYTVEPLAVGKVLMAIYRIISFLNYFALKYFF